MFWDAPAEGVLAAARSAGRNNLVITMIDLGTNVALDIASGGMIKGLGRSCHMTKAGRSDPSGIHAVGQRNIFLLCSSFPISYKRILDAWKTVYGSDVPSTIQDAAK